MASAWLATLLSVEHAGRWKYRGEGAANVVVCYTGVESNLVGKVLRISKAAVAKERSAVLHASPQPHFDLNGGGDVGLDRLEGLEKETSHRDTPLLEPLEQEVWSIYPALQGAKTGVELNHEYAKHVMGPLLGEDFVDAGVPVPAKEDFLDQLIANIEPSRPARWQKEGPLMLLCGWALLITDHTSLQTGTSASGSGQKGGGSSQSRGPFVCLEIKPKAGFLSTSECISPENRVKLEKSRYELMQYLKAKQRKVDAISSYNPLDLFSSDSGRVGKAINSLFDNPQNNLRVFVDGEIVTWTFDVSSSGEDCQGGIESALEKFCAPVDGSRLNVLKELVVQRLAGSVILQRLRDTQMLDRYDIEGIIHLYRLLCGQTVDGASADRLPVATKQLLSLPRDAQLDILRDYMIATTAKDCGLMLTFGPLEAGAVGECQDARTSNPTVQKLHESLYLSKVGYVDLDLKRLKKIPKYWDLDQQIVVAYASEGQI